MGGDAYLSDLLKPFPYWPSAVSLGKFLIVPPPFLRDEHDLPFERDGCRMQRIAERSIERKTDRRMGVVQRGAAL